MDRNAVLECVPNFSEGRDPRIVDAIRRSIESVEGVKVLQTDMGRDAHRTVITFVGHPDAVVEAAFRMAQCAAELIDMRRHHGEHPRIGATDVLPLVPVRGVTLAEAAQLARQLARRLAREAHIPCYCYEAAAFTEERRRLEECRQGEYEEIARRWDDPLLSPDFRLSDEEGGLERALQTGVTVVGARPFLVAVNFSLSTRDVSVARDIAATVRQSGRLVTAPDGTRRRQPGLLPGTKAIGWWMEEYGCAQVSMNLCDLALTPLHAAFLEVCRQAEARGVSVTDTEIIGLVPMQALTDAAAALAPAKEAGLKGPVSTSENHDEEIAAAVSAMRMWRPRPFVAAERVIELAAALS